MYCNLYPFFMHKAVFSMGWNVWCWSSLTNAVSTKHVWQCCARILQALQGIKSVAVLIKWKGFQNVLVIFPLKKKINQQQRLETARCHGEPQQDRAAGVCVHTKRLRLCQFQPESPPWCPLPSATARVCVCAQQTVVLWIPVCQVIKTM